MASAPKQRPRVRVIPVEAMPEFQASTLGSSRKVASESPALTEPVARAVRRAVDFLQGNPERWLRNGPHDVGYAALIGLALVEAGVPPDDPVVRRAAGYVRRRAPGRAETYEISLSILFLDRLAEPADADLVRTLALRLIAGQTVLGGWDYRCPSLPDGSEQDLFTALQAVRPTPAPQFAIRVPGKGLMELQIPQRAGLASAAAVEGHKARAFREPPSLLRGLPVFRERPAALPGDSAFPALGSPSSPWGQADDNSNTQFALLALWAARRHGLPVERSLLLADRRFGHTQRADGSWGYRVGQDHGQRSMTCVGLLGMALGHGALLPTGAADDAAPGPDPAIARGLVALGRWVGDPAQPGGVPAPELYFLWSLERVAMLYRLPTVGGKDWYAWGSQFLLVRQASDGSWHVGGYPGSDAVIDTAFALLFLHRSNLVQDLSERLPLRLAISDPAARTPNR